jgi:hypothetical protein
MADVRRSPRLSALSKGFKRKTRFDRNWLACAALAPKLKKRVITNLWEKFSLPDVLGLEAPDPEHGDLEDLHEEADLSPLKMMPMTISF